MTRQKSHAFDSEKVGRYTVIHGNTRLYMAIHGITWPYMAIHGYTRLMAVYGN